MRAWTTLLFLCAWSACECGPLGLDETRFTCTTSDDCLEGFACDGVECVPAGSLRPDAGEEEDAGELLPDAGLPDAGGPDAGDFDAGVLSLHFLTTQQNVAVDACSAIALVEARAEGAPYAVPQGAVVTLGSTPAGVRFFEAPTCAGAPISTAAINAGGTNVHFYMSAPAADLYTVRASSPGFLPATQDLEVGVSPQIIALSGVPGQVRGGQCTAVTVELRRAGMPDTAAAAVVVSLTSMNAGQVAFYSSSSCGSTTSSVTIAAGASSAQFWMKPFTAGPQTIVATAPFDGDQLSFNTTGIVRRVGCSFTGSSPGADGGVVAGQTSRSCSFTPAVTDLGASFVVSQFTANVSGAGPNAASLRCRLSGTTTVQCTRSSDAVAGNAYLQIAEVPQHLRVQRVSSGACPASIAVLPLDGGTTPFILKTVSSGTTELNGNHTAVARYVAPDTVTTTPGVCGGYEHQLVEWSGVTVTTGELDGGLTAGQLEATVTGLPAVSTDAVVLVASGMSNATVVSACSVLVRGELASPTSVRLSRAAGDAGCPLTTVPQVTWQRIDFGARARVDAYRVDFTPAQTVRTITIAPVDTTRTLMLTSSQSFGGQGAGETDDPSSSRASTGTFLFSLPGSSSLEVRRATAGSAASVTVYVVELSP